MSTVTRFSQVGRGLHAVSSALPSVSTGFDSRQRVIELGEGRVGLPMLMREVGSSRDVRARPAQADGAAWRPPYAARVCGAASASPAAMAGFQGTRWVTMTWSQRSRAAAHAARAC